MSREIIVCPKDSELKYYRDICEEVFRKGKIRHWCKECKLFDIDGKNEKKL